LTVNLQNTRIIGHGTGFCITFLMILKVFIIMIR